MLPVAWQISTRDDKVVVVARTVVVVARAVVVVARAVVVVLVLVLVVVISGVRIRIVVVVVDSGGSVVVVASTDGLPTVRLKVAEFAKL